MRVQEHIVVALRDLVCVWILFGSVLFVSFVLFLSVTHSSSCMPGVETQQVLV